MLELVKENQPSTEDLMNSIWDCMEADVALISDAVGLSFDEAALIVHILLKRIIDHQKISGECSVCH